jgi:hypothetical protein
MLVGEHTYCCRRQESTFSSRHFAPFFSVRTPRELLCYEPIMSLMLLFFLLVAALGVSTHHLTRPCAPGIAFRLTPEYGSVVPMPSTTHHRVNAHVNR